MGSKVKIGEGLHARVAENSYGRPVCIEPDDGRDESLAVTVYEHEGAIVGVRVTEGLHGEVGAIGVEYGLVPDADMEPTLEEVGEALGLTFRQ